MDISNKLNSNHSPKYVRTHFKEEILKMLSDDNYCGILYYYKGCDKYDAGIEIIDLFGFGINNITEYLKDNDIIGNCKNDITETGYYLFDIEYEMESDGDYYTQSYPIFFINKIIKYAPDEPKPEVNLVDLI